MPKPQRISLAIVGGPPGSGPLKQQKAFRTRSGTLIHRLTFLGPPPNRGPVENCYRSETLVPERARSRNCEVTCSFVLAGLVAGLAASVIANGSLDAALFFATATPWRTLAVPKVTTKATTSMVAARSR